MRISYESLDLSSQESLGLAGVHYLADVAPWLSAGAAGFGAVSGRRGGFFTGGLEAAFRRRLSESLEAEAGIFAGGGGGGSAPQGGGLMVRPYAGLSCGLRSYRVGLQYARVEFPNGNIADNHLALAFDIPFDLLLLPARYDGPLGPLPDEASRTAGKEAGFSRDSFAAVYQVYFPAAGARNTGGLTKTKTFGTLGLEYARDYGDRSALLVEAAGAVEGAASGYAEVFAGPEYRNALFQTGPRRLFFDARLLAGAAGGGGVDTGGGFSLKTSLGLKYFFDPALSAGISGGYMAAPGGRFRAATGAFAFAYQADFLSLEGAAPRSPADELYLDGWEAGFSQQTYLTRNPRVRKSSSGAPVSLVGLKLRRTLSPSLALTGQTWGAYAGGAGGYAAGLLGLRVMSEPLFAERLHVFAELSAGGAGGGGIPVGGGAVAQAMTGLSLDLADSFGMELAYGRIEAVSGALDSAVVEAGLVYRFSTLGRKITGEHSTRR